MVTGLELQYGVDVVDLRYQERLGDVLHVSIVPYFVVTVNGGD
jgi:hypothetical protein